MEKFKVTGCAHATGKRAVLNAIAFAGIWLVAVLCLLFGTSAQAQERQQLHGHVPAATANLVANGRPEPVKRLNLAIGLPLRNQDELSQLLRQLYDPASLNYRKYLTTPQFTEKFGPTEDDYQKVIQFAEANGLKVTARHPNRVVLDVEGTVSDIEKALHVTMRTYQHPTEARTFYAPDSEPSLDLPVPVLHISGLTNYSLPHPKFKKKPAGITANATPNAGSAPSGSYAGGDFRAAYTPGTSLTGAGQSVALLQFEGYYESDITAYKTQFGLPDITLVNVPIDGGVSTPGPNDTEVCLDIEMVMAMAPGVSTIYVYEAPNPSPWVDLLSRMANDNVAKQLSCSWGGGSPDPTAEGIFQQMAAQGQSFYNASGDSDAYTGAVEFPADSPNITQVGGTTLTTSGPGGTYTSETVWNWNNGVGSCGGISTYYTIPSWQQGISMTASKGSTTMRNIPDVAMTADNIYIRSGNGGSGTVGGTSCAAPLWAGFTALVNEQAVANGRPTVGFINSAVYAVGQGSNYSSNFHDITVGNNYSPSSPSNFPAVTGYDLCTGLGTPSVGLINALAGSLDNLQIPFVAFTSTGPKGGPFASTSQDYTLTNVGNASLNWTAGKSQSWLDLSSSGGTLAVSGSAVVTVSLNASASSLAVGTYTDTVAFTNTTSGVTQNRSVILTVTQGRLFYFSMDSDPGWTRQGQWAFGVPTGGGAIDSGNPDPTSGFTGSNVMGVNLSGDYSRTIGGPYYLTAGPLNFTGAVNSKLQFERWLNNDYQPYAYATIEVSTDGTNWTSIWNNGTSEVADSSWRKVQYDISAYADNQPTFYVRWGYQVASGAYSESGWNIDDVEFLATPTLRTVTPSAGAHGSISPNTPQSVSNGGSIGFTATPASQYTVDQWLVDGVLAQTGGTSFTLNNVTSDTTVQVTFKPTYSVTPSAGANGSISPNTVQTVGRGNSTSFTATPAVKYAVNQWFVNGVLAQTGGLTFTLNNVTANKTVQVTFKAATKGDFNWDGRTDMLLVNPVSRQTSISYLNGTSSTGVVSGPVLSPGWQLIDIADFDRDGKQDYVLFNPATRQTAIWYLNDVTYLRGSFGPTLPAGFVLAAVADFNSDGKPDFVLVNHATGETAVWYLNNSVYVSSATGPSLPAGYALAGVADFDADTNPDFVLFNPANHATAIWYLTGAAFKSSATGPTIHSAYTLIGAPDLNNDGKPDFLLLNTSTNATAFWYMNNASQAGTAIGPTVPAGSILPTSTLMPTPVVGDINQDGQPDLTLFKSTTGETQVTYLNGAASSGNATGPVITSGWKLVDAADFDGDTKLDYLLFNPITRQTAIWYLNGVTLLSSAFGPILSVGYDLIGAADLNGDGKPDLVLLNRSSGQTAIWFMNNNAFVSSVLGPTLASGYSLVGVADFDGDANPDLVLFNPQTRATAIWYLSGTTFKSSAYGPVISSGYTLSGVADLNADGRPDFILVNTATNATAFWYMYNSTNIGTAFGPALPSGWSLAAP